MTISKQLYLRTLSVDSANTFSEQTMAWFTDRMVDVTVVCSEIIRVRNVKDFVTKVRVVANRGEIKRLIHMGHGLPNAFDIGDDSIQGPLWPTYQPYFDTLKDRFAKDAYVHLQNCYIGMDEGLLRKIAASFGVPVWAGTDHENPILHMNFGSYTVAFPNGKILRNQTRPQYLA